MYVLNKDVYIQQYRWFSQGMVFKWVGAIQCPQGLLRILSIYFQIQKANVQCSCVQNAGKDFAPLSLVTEWEIQESSNKVSCSAASQIARLLSSSGWPHPIENHPHKQSSKVMYHGLQLTLDISSVHPEGHSMWHVIATYLNYKLWKRDVGKRETLVWCALFGKAIVTGHRTIVEREMMQRHTLELLPGYCCSLHNKREIKIRVFSVDGDNLILMHARRSKITNCLIYTTVTLWRSKVKT